MKRLLLLALAMLICPLLPPSVCAADQPVYVPHYLEKLSNRGFATHYGLANQSEERDAEMLLAAGVQNIRDDLNWHKIEKTDGSFDYAAMDSWVLPRAQEFRLLPILAYSHTRYNGMDPSDPNSSKGALRTKEGVDAYANYVRQTIRHYPMLDRFEVYNEPDNDGFWYPKENAFDYTNLLKRAGSVIREERPGAKVMTGGLAWAFKQDFSGDMLKYGAYPYMDALTVHPYLAPELPDEEYVEISLGSQKALLLSYGGFKELTITEYGWATFSGSYGVTEREQADKYVIQNVLGDFAGVTDHMMYTFRDKGTDPDDKEHNYGVLKRDFTPKEAYYAVIQLNSMLNGAVYVGRISLLDGVQTHLYVRDGSPFLVVWAEEGSQQLTLAGTSVQGMDIFGQPVSGSPFTVTRSPLYITGISKDLAVQCVYENLQRCYGDWMENYGSIAGAEGTDAIRALADNVADIPAYDTLDATWVQNRLTQHMDAGQAILAGDAPDLALSQMLSELYDAALYWRGLLATFAMDAPDLHYQQYVTQAEEIIQTRLAANHGGSLPYAEAILTFARRDGGIADTIGDARVQTGRQDANGWETANGILASGLAKWAGGMAETEACVNTDILFYISGEDLELYHTDGIVRVHVSNGKAIPLSGEIQFSVDGMYEFTSDWVTVPAGGEIVVEVPAGQGQYGGEPRVEAAVRFVDGQTMLAEQALYLLPEEPLGPLERLTQPPAGSVEKTPAEHIFTVEGQAFILLDVLEGDHFYVLAKDDYGKQVFDPDNLQKFDPQDPNNIAYWLNHTFLTEGNGGKRLPQSMLPYLDDTHVYRIEAGDPRGPCRFDYNVTCAVSLLSQTEYVKYAGKFGIKDGTNTDDWWLRTGRGINGSPDVLLSVSRQSDGTLGHTQNRPAKTATFIRPTFCLRADFFREVKLEPESMGESVRKALADHVGAAALSEIYSIAELQEMGFDGCDAALLGLTDAQGAPIETVEAAVQAVQVTISARFAALGQAGQATVYGCVYGESGDLKAVRVFPVTLQTDTADLISLPWRLPADITAQDQIKLYVWDGNMRPLDDCYQLA